MQVDAKIGSCEGLSLREFVQIFSSPRASNLTKRILEDCIKESVASHSGFKSLNLSANDRLSLEVWDSLLQNSSCFEAEWHARCVKLWLLWKETTVQPKLSPIDGLLAGGLAGACAKTVIAPGDRVKIIFQVSPIEKYSLKNAFNTARDIVKQNGLFGLWKGHGATLMRVIPHSATTYMTFDLYHERLLSLSWNPESTVSVKFLSGSLAGATAVLLAYPLDVLRARLAATRSSLYHTESYYTLVRGIITQDGIRALYQGLTPTLIGIIPYAGTSFAVYGSLKSFLVAHHQYQSEHELSKFELLCSGALAGIIAQSATYPLDILRRRMQVVPSEYSSLLVTCRKIYLQEGWRAFYKGLSMNWIKGPIASGVSFTINDTLKRRMRHHYSVETQANYEIFRDHSFLEQGAVPHKENLTASNLSFIEAFFAGAVAGAAAKFWTTPIERIKILYQVNERPFTLQRARKSVGRIILHQENGFFALWRGSSASMLRVPLYAGISYSIYDSIQESVAWFVYAKHKDFATCFLSGSIAGAVATAITYPIDVLRVRMAAHWYPEPKYASTLAGLRTEGLLSLTSGLKPAMIGGATFVGLSFALYDALKCRFSVDSMSPMYQKVACGAVAGLSAQMCTYPIHMVTRKIQVSDILTHGGPLYESSSVLQVLRDIYMKQGLLHGWYKGLRLTWMIGPLSIGLSFAIYDVLGVKINEARRDRHQVFDSQVGGDLDNVDRIAQYFSFID